jgi:hypothetical protein
MPVYFEQQELIDIAVGVGIFSTAMFMVGGLFSWTASPESSYTATNEKQSVFAIKKARLDVKDLPEVETSSDAFSASEGEAVSIPDAKTRGRSRTKKRGNAVAR